MQRLRQFKKFYLGHFIKVAESKNDELNVMNVSTNSHINNNLDLLESLPLS